MPFTPTHIVAALPLWPLRRTLPFAALAIGSMVPDLPMYFPVVDYAQTHAPMGVFTICLPIGFALFLLFEFLMRRPLVELLPHRVGRRIPSESRIPTGTSASTHLRFYTGVALAIVIGAFTHQIWDAFTHQGRWGTQLVPCLHAQVEIGGYLVPGYKVFQYGSTLVGLPLLVVFAVLVLRRTTTDDKRAPVVSVTLKRIVACIALTTPVVVGTYAYTAYPTAYQALGVTIRRTSSIMLIGGLVYSVLFHVFTRGDYMLHKASLRSPEAAEK